MADSSSSSLKGGAGSRSHRAWTVSESDTMETASRQSNGRSSIDSSERPKTQGSEGGDSAKAGSSGFSKLLKSRRRKKKNQKGGDADVPEVPAVPGIITEHEFDEPSSNGSRDAISVATSSNSPVPRDTEVINLLTDDSEPDRTPPLTSHNSHTGFYTSSSPLIQTTPAEAATDMDGTNGDVESAISAPSATGSESNPGEGLHEQTANSGLTLDVPGDSSSKRRSPSPGRRRLKDAFSSDKKGTNEDVDSSSSKSGNSKSGRSIFGGRRSSLSSKRAQAQASQDDPPPVPSPIQTTSAAAEATENKKRVLQDSALPNTPPDGTIPFPPPETTVTPPTPTEHRPSPPQIFTQGLTDSPESIPSRNSISSTGITVSPSGNMISHRRVRSASAAHGPSKLSTSMSVLTPLEEAKTPKSGASQQTGFFSSMFSAAQNAASSFTNTLNAPQKRSSLPQVGTTGGDSSLDDDKSLPAGAVEKTKGVEEGKPTALETLGSGDLDFSHLGVDAPSGEVVSTADGVVVTKPSTPVGSRKNTAVYQRDEASARLEDRHAARAVTMAYEKPLESTLLGSPGDEVIESQSTISLPRDGVLTGDHTPPTGSVIDGDIGSGTIRRTGSVRSRLGRRHRGSSGATTASTIGAIGASAINLGIPGINSSVPRLTGFAVASKKRNRDFHQLFRSVPEDDYLIEDYSCALQREIILAGRIYISEGHICFSSNILGWVTTLVISFDEVVAIEKESTAVVFPNAIAIQTLHARHTFRSLLSRESTYDLMVNIWKINHPSLKSSVNGTRVTNGTGDKTEKVGEGEAESDSDSDVSDEDEIYDEDEEGHHAESFFEAGASANVSERSLPGRAGLTRQTSGLSGNGPSTNGPNAGGDAKAGDKASSPGESDFPGPATHAATEYTNPDGQYEKVLKDEVIAAPLGKVYSLVFGPASGDFMTKFLVENQKSGELQFEGTTKGLTNESRVRKYSYIKPLNAPIGPKQTKCITTENLDFLDLEKAVLVTLGTQTPDVPSGNVFAVKTKYLFTWAANNQTRFLMTCTIEWTGKSWLKGPIEKGAIDGQTTFGTDLLKALKSGVLPRGRAPGGGRGKGRRKKGDAAARESSEEATIKAVETKSSQSESWGLLEPIRPILEPFTSMLKPLWSGNIAILLVGILLYMAFFRTPSSSSALGHNMGCPGLSLPQRLAAYDEMWRREESELWNWLEDRAGMDGMVFPALHHRVPEATHKAPRVNVGDELDLMARLREEKVSDREMDHAIRTTRQRLDILEEMVNNRRVDRTDHGPQEPIKSEL